jgi:hypothetical protein
MTFTFTWERHPQDRGVEEIRDYLSHLPTDKKIVASTSLSNRGQYPRRIMMMRLYHMPELLQQANQAFIELFAHPQQTEQNKKSVLR